MRVCDFEELVANTLSSRSVVVAVKGLRTSYKAHICVFIIFSFDLQIVRRRHVREMALTGSIRMTALVIEAQFELSRIQFNRASR